MFTRASAELAMASQQRTVDFILEQIGKAGAVSARKMFGECGIYCDGKMVALVCDDMLFVKPTKAGRTHVGDAIKEGAPYKGAKPCFIIPEGKFDDAAWMAKLIKVSTAELPSPAKKRRAE